MMLCGNEVGSVRVNAGATTGVQAQVVQLRNT